MKLIRYILSHAILLALLIALGLAYYHRGELFTDDINAKIDNTVYKAMVFAQLAPKAKESETQEPQATAPEQTASEVTTDITPNTAEVIAESESSAPASTSEPAPDSALTATTQSETSEVPQEAETSVTETSQAETTNEQTAVVSPAEKNSVAVETKVQEPTEIVESDKEAAKASHFELINQARLAFQAGEHDKSVTLYQELISLDSDEPNAFGEMGNVYYAQGKWKQAGQAYYEAATRLLAKGQVEQVQYLYRVIQGLDQDSAKKLRSQLGR